MMSAKYFKYYTIILRGGRFFVDTLYYLDTFALYLYFYTFLVEYFVSVFTF